jgi:hypothetical protein
MTLGAEGRNDTFCEMVPRLGHTLAGKDNTNFQIFLQRN